MAVHLHQFPKKNIERLKLNTYLHAYSIAQKQI